VSFVTAASSVFLEVSFASIERALRDFVISICSFPIEFGLETGVAIKESPGGSRIVSSTALAGDILTVRVEELLSVAAFVGMQETFASNSYVRVAVSGRSLWSRVTQQWSSPRKPRVSCEKSNKCKCKVW
jgi:hypothetical protein